MARRKCTVLIAAPDLLPELTRAAGSKGNVLAFADTDALGALEAITARRPHVIALERLFATTPRGAALISRVKADPKLRRSEIRVVSESGDAVAMPVAATAEPPAALDQRGTRRAQRFRIAGALEVQVDGNASVLIDLSTVGAQIVRPMVLKPNQRVRVALADLDTTVRVTGVVAWASFEIPSGETPRYRAGIDFTSHDLAGVDAFRARHAES